MRVVIRSHFEAGDGAVVDHEVELSAEGTYAPDVCADLIDRAFNLWGWAFDSDEDAGAEES